MDLGGLTVDDNHSHNHHHLLLLNSHKPINMDTPPLPHPLPIRSDSKILSFPLLTSKYRSNLPVREYLVSRPISTELKPKIPSTTQTLIRDEDQCLRFSLFHSILNRDKIHFQGQSVPLGTDPQYQPQLQAYRISPQSSAQSRGVIWMWIWIQR